MAVSTERRRQGYRRLDNALTSVFVRNVKKAGRYADGCRLLSTSS